MRARWAPVALAAGAIVMVAGTFAPWLRSGDVSRNSYRTAGLLRRLLDLHGVAAGALDAMPLIAVICAGSAVVFALGWRRCAAIVVAVLALLLVALSVAVLLAPGGRQVDAQAWGPAITLGGAAVTLVAAASVLIHSVDRKVRQVTSQGVE